MPHEHDAKVSDDRPGVRGPQTLPLTWSVGPCEGLDQRPQRMVSATVPGAVQLDWAASEGWPDFAFGDRFKDYAWMEDRYWVYAATLNVPRLNAQERLFFCCGGVDYACTVRLHGRVIHQHEGMFTPFEIDLTGMAGEGDRLEVVVHPAPKSHPAPADRSQANQCCKPAVSYGWDWHPRLIPLGIWEQTRLEARPRVHLRRAEVRYELADDLASAQVRLEAELSHPDADARINWQLMGPDGSVVLNAEIPAEATPTMIERRVDGIHLWWPNGHGEPARYRSRVELCSTDGSVTQAITKHVGFRRVRLEVYEGAWDEPVSFPTSRTQPPITLTINHRPIFAKGTNWVNPDVFPGRITAETYRPLLQLAKDAHMNLLRVWGGGIVNKESFFDQCDELGLMVWQEFPLACNNYEGTPEYLAVLDRESRSIIRRLRQHPCVVLWCGGNELHNPWSRMTDQSLPLRLLNRNCYDLDPHTPYLSASPQSGMGHGNYLFRFPDGREVFQAMPAANKTAYTEFGVPSPADVDTLKAIIPEDDLFPPRLGTAWEVHHAFNAWDTVPSTWLCLEVLEHYFGEASDLATLVERGQLLQAEGYKCIYEEARRQKPRCSMALNWCYNEAWPCAANNSLVSWPARPKPALAAVAQACRPVLASARIAKFVWREGDTFDPQLWLLNDSPQALPAGRIEASVCLDDREHFLHRWDHDAVPANKNLPGPTLCFRLPAAPDGWMRLTLRSPDHPAWDSLYTLLFRA